MKQRTKIGLAIAGVGIGYYLYDLYSAASGLQFGQAKLTGKKFRLTDCSIFLNLPIINNDTVTLPFDRFDGQLLYNSRELAKIVVQKYKDNVPVPLPISANSTVILPVEVKVSYFKTASEIIDMFNSQSFLGNLEIVGVIKSKGVKFNTTTKIY